MKLYQMLPYLEGWDYTVINKIETVQQGLVRQVYSKETKGWLIGFDAFADDAFASVKIIYLGHTYTLTPQAMFIAGTVMPPPNGAYTNVYIRPSVLSTAGIFVYSPVTSAECQPIKGLVRVELSLTPDSTQVTATCGIQFGAIEITDADLFLKTVRRFLYGWFGWLFGAISNIPGLKYAGVPDEIREVMDVKKGKKEE